MYKVYAGNTLIFDDTAVNSDLKIINAVLTLEDNSAGSLEFTMLPDCPAYSTIERMKTVISVTKWDEEIWSGRVVSESTVFNLSKRVTCEGELSYLNDTIQPPAEYGGSSSLHHNTPANFLGELLSHHNDKVSASKRFVRGEVSVTDPNDYIHRYTNYEKTMECIQEKLIDKLGGHVCIRKENGVRYLDYYKNYIDPEEGSDPQVIEFGRNLMDFTKSFDMTDFATVIVPLGAPLETSPIPALTAYTDVSSVNNGSIYVYNQNTVNEFGWIAKVVHWDDVTIPQNLLNKAQAYLSETQFEEMRLEVSAVDLSYLNSASMHSPVNYEDIKLLHKVRVISQPHGLDRYFPVSKLTIPLDNPEKATFELGTTVKKSLTKAYSKGGR